MFAIRPNSVITFTLALAFAGTAVAQYAERSGLAGSGRPDVDVSGRSVKNPRVRAVHTDDPMQVGGTAYLIDRDPYLAYQLGRNLNFREFRERDGVFSSTISNLAGPMPDGTTAKITAQNQVSCSGCHNLPQGNAGGGVNFHKDSGFGRNTPHYYGAGLSEMLAIQTRAKMMRVLDTNGDGWVNVREARNAPSRLRIRPTDFGASINYGNPRLDGGRRGSPRLNNIFRVWYVDANGRHVPGATSVDGQTTFGYNFNMVVWGWGQGAGRAALNPTNRAFLWDPWLTHGGLDAHDPSTDHDPDGDGVSEPTLAGALQFPATHRAPDAGANMDALGFSRDDPDGDGHLTEISEGDLDLAEWFMLNAPRPAFAGSAWEYRVGLQMMESMGCADCHTADWKIEAEDASGAHPFAGDRRLFDLDVQYDRSRDRLEGTLVPLYRMRGGSYVREKSSFLVQGIFTDFRHHQMGNRFAEIDFGGNRNELWRTAPLWGVGDGYPWGHDGQSLTLDDVIRRHGGEARSSRRAYERAPAFARDFLIRNFLEKLVLYDVETLPTDIDGDGRVRSGFRVAGQNTGIERFNPEWLFRTPVRIQGRFTNTDGDRIRSFAATNLSDAYGLTLPLRKDSDLDGWPDVWDAAPFSAGYKNGVR